MIIILGLIILVVAAIVAVAGIFSNTGSAHAVNGAFSVFGHHLNGSTGTLFLFGIIVGAAAMLGLGLLLTGARRTSRRGLAARRDLRHSRRETAAVDKDREALAGQRDTARAKTATVAQERDDLTRQRDDLAEERDDLAGQRENLLKQREDLLDRDARPRATPTSSRAVPDRYAANSHPAPSDEEQHRKENPFGNRPASL